MYIAFMTKHIQERVFPSAVNVDSDVLSGDWRCYLLLMVLVCCVLCVCDVCV